MEISELLRSLLEKRGVIAANDISKFIDPDYQRDTHSPFLLVGMARAVARVLAAVRDNERIAVYADFDCDGIPGAALLWDFFKKIKHENLQVYIPHRDREGYGFHMDAIEQLAADGVSLIITVDVGTNALKAISFAKEKGIDVIVTDHHEVTGALPECVAVLNPKLGAPALSGVEGYPFRDLCGAAVAWKFAQALLIEGKKQGVETFAKVPEGWEKWLLDLVAIATIADLVPLNGENRALAHFGLKVLRRSQRPGITALCNVLRQKKSDLTEESIAFFIAPRVNAASRMGEPEFAFRLLVTDQHEEADRIARHLEELNGRRKVEVATIVKAAKRTVRTRFRSDERVIVLGSPDWKPALLGLAANSIMEERGGVVCLWGRDALGRIKGSCRSDGSISVVELFSAADDALVEFGGHHASGGFTVSHEKVHALHETLSTAAAKIAQRPSEIEQGAYDALISLPELTEALFEEVSKLAPFGIGNPKPLFLVSSITVSSVRRFGRDRNHVEVLVSCERTGISARAFDFFNSPEQFMHTPSIGAPVRILASLERDSYRGGLALRLTDVLPS